MHSGEALLENPFGQEETPVLSREFLFGQIMLVTDNFKPEPMGMLETALYYAYLQFSVIPIGNDKKPLIEWRKNQKEMADHETIRKWFQDYPNANIGIVTGQISGIVVIDIEKGGSIDDLPETVCAKTGGGGWHFYYRHPGHFVQNKTRIRDLTDIRGDGGYVIAPPSNHPSGEKYEWLKQPGTTKLADLPSWVLEETKKLLIEKDWKSILTGVPQGERNNDAAVVAGKLLQAFPQKDWETFVWPLLKDWNQQNQPPISDQELRAVYNSIAGRQKVNNSQFAAQRISIMPWKDFIKVEFEEPKWVIQDIIPENGLVAIAGSPESYKSFFAVYLAIEVAKGEPVLDKFETIKTPVLIIDQENIQAWLHQRLTGLSRDKDLPVYIFDKDVVPFDLFEEGIFDQILEFIEKNEIGLVIIDTLRLAHSKEENSSTEMKPVIDKLKEIARRAATVFIHHNRKTDRLSRGTATGEDMMGSILIRGAVDYQLTFTNLGEQADGLTKIKIAQTKARYTRPVKTFEVSLEEVDGKFTFVYRGEFEEEKLKRAEAKEIILVLLTEQDWKRQDIIDQLASDNICGSRTTEEALKELVEAGKIKHTQTKPHVYSLIEDANPNIPQTSTTNSEYEIAESLPLFIGQVKKLGGPPEHGDGDH